MNEYDIIESLLMLFNYLSMSFFFSFAVDITFKLYQDFKGFYYDKLLFLH